MSDIKPIRSAQDHAAALREIERLFDAAPGSAAADRLEVLTTLVAAYEAKRLPFPAADPVDVLSFTMTAQGRSQTDLANLLGSRSRASEVLNRRRPLSDEMIRKLSEAWAIPAMSLKLPGPTGGGGGWRRIVTRGAACLLVAAAATVAAGGGLLWQYGRDLPDTAALAEYRPASLVDLDDAGRLARNRSFMPLADIPPHVVKAFLAAEDKDFYRHGSVSARGLARAAALNLAHLLDGGPPAGGTGITEQVAKNVLLPGQPRSLTRRVKTVILAHRLEQTLSKDRILEIYLNEIYLGNGAYGVASAARRHFGKNLGDLTVAEAAYLAALPKAPENYRLDRADSVDRARTRRDWVLDRMAEDGLITVSAAHLARGEQLGPSTAN